MKKKQKTAPPSTKLRTGKKAVKKATPKNKAVKKAEKTKPVSKNTIGVLPLGDRVLIKPLSVEEMGGATTSFGIIIPDTAKEKPEQGTVVAVGPGRRGDDNELVPVAVSVGDRVMFSKYGFDEVKVMGQQYYIVSEQNILIILK